MIKDKKESFWCKKIEIGKVVPEILKKILKQIMRFVGKQLNQLKTSSFYSQYYT